jgi:Transglutaminase-like superfamily
MGLVGMPNVQEHYVAHDTMTDPGKFGSLYDRLPVDVSLLRNVVSQLIAHVSWSDRYQISATIPRTRETQSVSDRLRLIQTAFDGSLDALCPPDRRTFGTCRDYSLLLCSMLRHRAVPARVRCGFANYFRSAPYEDHWICEYWSSSAQRWRRVDAQIDEVQRQELDITFDLTDLPDEAYYTAGQAWKLVRRGGAEPDDFGHGDARGLWFLNVNLHRDLLTLTNQHTSAWDTWRSATTRSKHLDDPDLAFSDRIAMSIEVAEQIADGFLRLDELTALAQGPPWIDRCQV